MQGCSPTHLTRSYAAQPHTPPHPTPPHTQLRSPSTHPTPPPLTRKHAAHPNTPPQLTCRDASHPHTPPQPTWLIARHSSAILSSPRGRCRKRECRSWRRQSSSSLCKSVRPICVEELGINPKGAAPLGSSRFMNGVPATAAAAAAAAAATASPGSVFTTPAAPCPPAPELPPAAAAAHSAAAPHVFVDKGPRQVQNAEVDRSIPDDAGLQESARTAPRQIRHQAVTRRRHHHRHVRRSLRCGAVGWGAVRGCGVVYRGLHVRCGEVR